MAINVTNIVDAYIIAQGLSADPNKAAIETGITNLVQAIIDEITASGTVTVPGTGLFDGNALPVTGSATGTIS